MSKQQIAKNSILYIPVRERPGQTMPSAFAPTTVQQVAQRACSLPTSLMSGYAATGFWHRIALASERPKKNKHTCRGLPRSTSVLVGSGTKPTVNTSARSAADSACSAAPPGGWSKRRRRHRVVQTMTSVFSIGGTLCFSQGPWIFPSQGCPADPAQNLMLRCSFGFLENRNTRAPNLAKAPHACSQWV